MVGLKKDLELLRLWTKKHFSFSGSFLYVGGIDIFENKKEDVPFWYRFYIIHYVQNDKELFSKSASRKYLGEVCVCVCVCLLLMEAENR